MPKFTVIVTRDTTESCEIEIEAEGQDEAEEAALARSKDSSIEWEPDDTPNASADHYITGCEETPAAPLAKIEEAIETPREYAHTPETCPSKHWNDGDDLCADCGTDLQ